MMNAGMRFPPAPLMAPDETFEVDEHGNVNWRSQWMKEIGNLQHMTEQHEKSGLDPDWYRVMFLRVRNALMAPVGPGDNVVPPHAMPPQTGPGQQQQ
jgi:forkhead box protein J2/3